MIGAFRRARSAARAPLAHALLSIAGGLGFLADASAQGAISSIAQALPWPSPLNQTDLFDRASRASLIVYAAALDDAARLSRTELETALEVDSIDSGRIEKWLARERGRIVTNYEVASRQCLGKDWTCVGGVRSFHALARAGQLLQTSVPPDFALWRDAASLFAKRFALEELRLVAQFSASSNETGVFNSNEWTGDSLPDRTFALTFDDGPTGPAGTTDQTLAMINGLKLSAAFFLLGVRFESRLKESGRTELATLYTHQCVASHGWEHESHQRWAYWQQSIQKTHALLRETFPADAVLPLFRPPGGHRRPDSLAFFKSQALGVMLWNINSYDWEKSMNPDAVAKRVLILMLIRRHGIILFHDLYGNALSAVPAIVTTVGGAVTWLECHQLAQLPG